MTGRILNCILFVDTSERRFLCTFKFKNGEIVWRLEYPRAFAKEANISQGTTVDIGVKEGNLIIASLKKKTSLKDLLAKITDSNIHREVDFGISQGLEAF